MCTCHQCSINSQIGVQSSHGSEQHPGNATVSSTAIKYDSGKPPFALISKLLMEEMAKVRAFGAKKYSRDNWRLGFKFHRSIDAALRHIMAFKDGEDNDPESGLTHIAHALCCLEHLLNDFRNHPENDDRYKPGKKE